MEKANSPPVELLLVDDEKEFVRVLSKRLEKRGIHVTASLSGSDAIENLSRTDFDVILLDLKMEFMDGIETLKVIKEMKPEIPVFMITGHGSMEEARMGVDCGAEECLPKPYDLGDLIRKIRSAARNRKEAGHG